MATYGFTVSANSGTKTQSTTTLAGGDQVFYTCPASCYTLISAARLSATNVGGSTVAVALVLQNSAGNDLATLLSVNVPVGTSLVFAGLGQGLGTPGNSWPVYMSVGDKLVLRRVTQVGGTRSLSTEVSITEFE